MKVDLKEKIVKAAIQRLPKDGFVVLDQPAGRISASPDGFYWVQAWIKVPFAAVQKKDTRLDSSPVIP